MSNNGENTDSTKYGVTEDKQRVEGYHRSRRMFALIDDKLVIAPPGLPFSHFQWLEQMENLTPEQRSEVMENGLRGIIDDKGDLYFYSGYDFKWTPKAEDSLKKHLLELVEQTGIKNTAKVYGGLIKQKEAGRTWPPDKTLGTVSDLL